MEGEILDLLFTHSFAGATVTGIVAIVVLSIGLAITMARMAQAPQFGAALGVVVGLIVMILLNPWTAVLLVALAIIAGVVIVLAGARQTLYAENADGSVVHSERHGLNAVRYGYLPMPGDETQRPRVVVIAPTRRHLPVSDAPYQLTSERREN